MKKNTMYMLMLLGIAFFLMEPTVQAAGLFGSSSDPIDKMLNMPNMNNDFRSALSNIAHGIQMVGRSIVVIMTVLAGAMLALGVQEGRKLLWTYLFGIGIALNVGDFIWEMWGSDASFSTNPSPPTLTTIKLDPNTTDPGGDLLICFLNPVIAILQFAARNFQKLAFDLTLLFGSIKGMMDLALELNSGDKPSYIINLLLKIGFYLFLITNWVDGLNLCHSLVAGFEEMAYQATGITDMTNGSVGADKILNNAFVIILAMWNAIDASSVMVALVHIICMITTAILLIMVAVQVIVVRIEFWVMVAISVVLLPFGMINQLKYLSEKAIGGIFNCALKVFAMDFVTLLCVVSLRNMADQVETLVRNDAHTWYQNITLPLEMVLFSFVMYLIVKQIPSFISGLLNGTPSLSAADMKQAALSIVQTGAGTAGAIKGAAQATGGMGQWGGKGNMGANMASFGNAAAGMGMNFAGNLAKAGAGSIARPFTDSFGKAREDTLRYNGVAQEAIKAFREQAKRAETKSEGNNTIIPPSSTATEKIGSAVNAVASPIKTAGSAVGNAVAHPLKTLNNAGKDIKESFENNFGAGSAPHNLPQPQTESTPKAKE